MVVSLVAGVWQVIVENTYKPHTPKIYRAWGDDGTGEAQRHAIPHVPHNLSLRCPDKKWRPKWVAAKVFSMKKQAQFIDAIAFKQ